jgi:uncharacterized membrane protein YkoI
MQKKTMWITAAAVGAVIILGGAGVAVASSDAFDGDDDRAISTSSDNGGNDRSVTDDDRDDSDDRGNGGGNSGRDRVDDDRDGTDVPATAEERSAAEAAALDEVGQGTVHEFDTGDADDNYAYKVEITMDDGSSVEVELADDMKVLRVDRD